MPDFACLNGSDIHDDNISIPASYQIVRKWLFTKQETDAVYTENFIKEQFEYLTDDSECSYYLN